MSEFLFTSESVSEGHPDKVADQISDAVLDAILEHDPTGRVAAETLVSTGLVVMAGEITTSANVDYARVARDTIRRIGYNDPALRFDADGCAVMVCYGRQSPDIAQGVDRASDDYLNQGAGDQGLMFGYACDETPTLMPFPIYYAHRLVQRQSEVRRDGRLPWLRPDAKSQVTVRYVDGKPRSVDTVVLSTQHHPSMNEQAEGARRGGHRGDRQAGVPEGDADRHAIHGQSDRTLRNRRPARRRGRDGPQDHRRHVRRRRAARRWRVLRQGSVEGRSLGGVCRALCREEHRRRGLAKQCQVQLSYAIGVAKPINVTVYTEGTGRVSDAKIVDLVHAHFDLRPKGIIRMLDLLRPIYRKTASYGHFGRDEPEFTWEATDKVEALREAAGLRETAVAAD